MTQERLRTVQSGWGMLPLALLIWIVVIPAAFVGGPMINRGGWRVKVQRDGWTIVTADKSMSAHFEHTVLVGEQSAEILTMI